MKFLLERGGLRVVREPGDKKYYNESNLLHAIKKGLQEMGFDVIKKRMWKDGHMYGSDTTQYIRTRHKGKTFKPYFYVYDGRYAVRLLNEDWNEKGEVDLIFDLETEPSK